MAAGLATPVFAGSATQQAQVLIIIPERREPAQTDRAASPAAPETASAPADVHVTLSQVRDLRNRPVLLYTYTPVN